MQTVGGDTAGINLALYFVYGHVAFLSVSFLIMCVACGVKRLAKQWRTEKFS